MNKHWYEYLYWMSNVYGRSCYSEGNRCIDARLEINEIINKKWSVINVRRCFAHIKRLINEKVNVVQFMLVWEKHKLDFIFMVFLINVVEMYRFPYFNFTAFSVTIIQSKTKKTPRYLCNNNIIINLVLICNLILTL